MSTGPVWRSADRKFRVVHDDADKAWLVQAFHNEDWRALSQHEDWATIKLRWAEADQFMSLPDIPPSLSLLVEADEELVRTILELDDWLIISKAT